MSDRGYTDPQLWIRLEPRLRKELTNAEQDVLQQRVTTYSDYVNAMGYIRALRDVFKIAAELQKIEGYDDGTRRDVLQKSVDDLRRSRDTWGMMD